MRPYLKKTVEEFDEIPLKEETTTHAYLLHVDSSKPLLDEKQQRIFTC